MVRTWQFHCLGSIHSQGIKVPKAALYDQKGLEKKVLKFELFRVHMIYLIKGNDQISSNDQNFISLYFCITAKILRPFSALRCYLLVPFNSFLFTVWAVRSSSPGTACGVYILSTELWGRLLSTKAQNLVQCILGSRK